MTDWWMGRAIERLELYRKELGFPGRIALVPVIGIFAILSMLFIICFWAILGIPLLIIKIIANLFSWRPPIKEVKNQQS